jgi:hypothetical protein
VVLGIISLNSGCSPTQNKKMMITDCSVLKFLNSQDSIVIKKDEYNILENAVGFEIIIKESHKVKELETIINPSIEFCFNGETIRAVGNNLFSSELPKYEKHFFPLNEKENIVFFKGNTIVIRKIM